MLIIIVCFRTKFNNLGVQCSHTHRRIVYMRECKFKQTKKNWTSAKYLDLRVCRMMSLQLRKIVDTIDVG